MTRTFVGLAPLTLAVASLAFACGGDDAPTTDGTDTTAGDGDGDPSGDGDGDPTGDGDGDPGDGDADTDEPDSDMDGVADSADNCPDVANPNQLDFDGNGMGNSCDVMVFNATGMMNTTANADLEGSNNSCSIPLVIEVLDGQVMVQLDDDAAMAGFEIANLNVADILDKECDLGLATATVSMTNFVITNSGGPFPVSIPHTSAMHDAGQVAGDADIPPPVLSTATLSASVNDGEPMDSELMLDGALPLFTANITGGGEMGTMAWADGQFVLATDQFMVPVGPIMATINFELKGLVGTLTLAP